MTPTRILYINALVREPPKFGVQQQYPNFVGGVFNTTFEAYTNESFF
jgi:hypothetical protein